MGRRKPVNIKIKKSSGNNLFCLDLFERLFNISDFPAIPFCQKCTAYILYCCLLSEVTWNLPVAVHQFLFFSSRTWNYLRCFGITMFFFKPRPGMYARQFWNPLTVSFNMQKKNPSEGINYLSILGSANMISKKLNTRIRL